MYDTSVDAVGCAKPFWYQDVCQRKGCTEETTGHVRVELKPTAYTRSGTADNYTYTAVTENTLKTGTTYYTQNANGTYSEIANISYYNANLKPDGKTYYTDANGYYNRQPGGTHIWGDFLTKTADGELIDYQNNEQLTGFVQPTCTTDGKVLYQCSVCKEYAWMDVDLETYANAMHAAAANTSKASQYPAYADAVKLAKYHDGEMFTCGHAECTVCKTQEHEVQYAVYFTVALDKQYENVAVPSIDTFYGWTCWIDSVEVTNLGNYIDELEADKEFTYTFYSDADMTVPMNWTPVGQPVGENAYSQYITVYVKAEPKVAFTVEYDTTGLLPVLVENDVFDPYDVYVVEEDKDQVAPTISGYVLHFYQDANRTIEFSFADYDWDNATGTVTIYVG